MRKRFLSRAGDLFPWACILVAIIGTIMLLWALNHYTTSVEADGPEDFGASVRAEQGRYDEEIARGRARR